MQQVVQGSSVTLECQADGNPTAAISWSRQQGHLPSGAQSNEVIIYLLLPSAWRETFADTTPYMFLSNQPFTPHYVLQLSNRLIKTDYFIINQ